jgi:GNAT superfamily N-acetyltransferase
MEFGINIDETASMGCDLPESDDPKVTSGAIAKGAIVRFQRIGTRGASRSATRTMLSRMMKRDKERWNIRHMNFVAYIWEGTVTQGSPVGFCAFEITLERTPRGRIRHVSFVLDLIYIVAASRGRGLGQMLAGSFDVWLSHCRVYGSRVTRRGVSVFMESEYYSTGGEKAGEIVAAHLRVFEEEHGVIPAAALGWNVREFNLEAGV